MMRSAIKRMITLIVLSAACLFLLRPRCFRLTRQGPGASSGIAGVGETETITVRATREGMIVTQGGRFAATGSTC